MISVTSCLTGDGRAALLVLKGKETSPDEEGDWSIIIKHEDIGEVMKELDLYRRTNMGEFTKEQVDQMFYECEYCRVIFEKRDGSIREMNCTKKIDLVPQDQRPKGGDDQRQRPEHLCTVFELDNDWRSFRYDSVIDIREYIIEE